MTDKPNNVPFFMHDLGKAELDAVAEVLANPFLPRVNGGAFERRLCGLPGSVQCGRSD